MLDDPFKYGLLAMLAIALLVAAFTDLRSRHIGNWLNGAIALAAFAVLAGLFALRAMGGGDVKLLTALALWIAPMLFLKLLVVMALVGGVLTLVFGAWHVMRKRREKLAIPYGVAIALAGLWVLGTNYLPSSAAGGLG